MKFIITFLKKIWLDVQKIIQYKIQHFDSCKDNSQFFKQIPQITTILDELN